MLELQIDIRYQGPEYAAKLMHLDKQGGNCGNPACFAFSVRTFLCSSGN